MNEKDHKNLMFILHATQESFDQWAEGATEDDLKYALELIAAHKRELMDMEVSLFDEVNDFTEANEIINRVKKGVSK